MSPFRKLAEHEVFRGHVFGVVIADFESPDGERFEREIVRHPGAVCVVPVIDEGTAAILVRQFRAPIERAILEVPAGKRDVRDEQPDVTARRELVEEIGMRAGRLELLAQLHMTPGFCDEHMTIFMALDLEECPTDLQGPEERHMTLHRVALDDVPDLIAAGEIADAKTIMGLLLAREAVKVAGGAAGWRPGTAS